MARCTPPSPCLTTSQWPLFEKSHGPSGLLSRFTRERCGGAGSFASSHLRHMDRAAGETTLWRASFRSRETTMIHRFALVGGAIAAIGILVLALGAGNL